MSRSTILLVPLNYMILYTIFMINLSQPSILIEYMYGSTSCTTSATATTAPISDLTIILTPPDTALSAAIAAAVVPLTLATPLEAVSRRPGGAQVRLRTHTPIHNHDARPRACRAIIVIALPRRVVCDIH